MGMGEDVGSELLSNKLLRTRRQVRAMVLAKLTPEQRQLLALTRGRSSVDRDLERLVHVLITSGYLIDSTRSTQVDLT